MIATPLDFSKVLAKNFPKFTFSPKPHVAIFEPNSDLATNPSILCLIEEMVKMGYNIDLLIPTSDRFPMLREKVSIFPYTATFKNIGDTPICTANKIINNFRRLILEAIFAAGFIKVIIGIDSKGLIKASRYSRRYNIPLVYLNFEIFFWDELISVRDIEEKKLECDASALADLVIIQDEFRASLLAKENKIPMNKFTYLPVSPGGVQTLPKSNYLRNRFNLSDEHLIVLHSGSFENWTYAEELIENVRYWPKNIVLVVHTRYTPNQKNRFINTLRESNLSNVILSVEPLMNDDYERLVASADIGLVLYKTIGQSKYTQKNIKHIGLASGKFAYFMKHGIPIISLNQPNFSNLLRDYSFGENISCFSEMVDGIMRLHKNYAFYSSEAKRIYREKLDFCLHWPSIYDRMYRYLQ